MKASSLFAIQRSVISISIMVGTLAISLYALVKANYTMLLGLVVVLFLPFLIQSPAWLLILSIAFYGADMTLPILPASLTLHSFLAGSLAVWLVVRKLITRSGYQPRQGHFASTFFLFLYLSTIVMIMIIRGTGMRVLGSDLWGGGKYIILLTSMAFFWTAPAQPLTSRQWTLAVLLLTAGFLTPFISQWIVTFSGGQVDPSSYVRLTSDENPNVDISDLQTTLVRIFPLGNLGIALGLCALLLIPVRLPHVMGQGFVLLIALVLIGLSGFRSHFIILGGTLLLYSFYFRENRAKGRHMLILLLVGACCWALLYLITPSLPPLMQRTLSIVPGLGISEDVQANAMGTVSWRVELWKFSLQMASPYRWIGRGFLYSQSELPQFDYTTNYLYMYLHHSYHNGPLSLLIDTGIPGLIFCSAFFLAAVRETFRRLGEIPSETEFGRAYRVLFAYLIVQVVYFYAIIGDPMASVTQILFTFTLLKILVTSHRAAQAEPPSEPRAFPPS